jgi:hypothetical protein
LAALSLKRQADYIRNPPDVLIGVLPGSYKASIHANRWNHEDNRILQTARYQVFAIIDPAAQEGWANARKDLKDAFLSQTNLTLAFPGGEGSGL